MEATSWGCGAVDDDEADAAAPVDVELLLPPAVSRDDVDVAVDISLFIFFFADFKLILMKLLINANNRQMRAVHRVCAQIQYSTIQCSATTDTKVRQKFFFFNFKLIIAGLCLNFQILCYGFCFCLSTSLITGILDIIFIVYYRIGS